MSQFILSIVFCIFASSVFVLSDTPSNVSSSPGEVLISKIPLVDILKELHGGGLESPQPGDLNSAAATNPGRKIVGVKKHKNYEIVLYEYSDEDSNDQFNDFEDNLEREQPSTTTEHENANSDEFLKEPTTTTLKPKSKPTPPAKDEFDLDPPSTRKPKKLPKSKPILEETPDEIGDDLRSRDPTKWLSQTRSKHKKTTMTPSSISRNPSSTLPKLNQRPRKHKPTTTSTTTERVVDNDEEQHISDIPKRPNARPITRDDYSDIAVDEDDVDVFDNSDDYTQPPSFGQRDQPRRGPSNSDSRTSRPKKPRIVGLPKTETDEDDGFLRRDEDNFFQHREEDDREIFFTTPKTRKSQSQPTQSQSTRKPGRQGEPRLKKKRPQSGDADFEEGGPGAGRFKPTRRPLVFDPQRSQRNKTEAESNEAVEQEYVDADDPESGVLCKDPTGKRGICQEYFTCSVLYSNMAGKINLEDYKCKLPNHIGICCPIVEERNTQGQRGRALMTMIGGKKVISRQIRKLIRSNFNNSINFGSDSVGQLDEIEDDLLTRSIQTQRNTPAFGHNRFFPTSKKIRQVSNIGFELLQTSNDLSDRLQLTNEVGGLGLKSFRSSNTGALNDRCPSLRPCGINKYRQIDGSCNNLRKPKMGQSLTPLSRVLEPAYADGRWSPRISVRGFNLPSPRLLSQAFIQDRDNPDNRFTLMVMQFGQFVDHDISSVPIFTFANNSGIVCCRNGQFLPPELRHPNCMPVEIPANDPFYSRFNQRCMNFVRSRMAPRIDCSLGYADQMNAVTHWLDLSNVYGSTDAESRTLRLHSGGLLRFSELEDRKMLLPLKSGREIDYKAGDDRVNEMQGLMILHLLWFREHNRIAFELARINPSWDDEQLFQESRRIIIAQYQHIIYNEWLPIVVGRDYMDSYGILPLTRGYFRGYDPEVDSSIENSFSSAGFRFGHTLVQGIVKLINELGQDNEQIVISENSDNAKKTRNPNQIDRWIRGLAQQPIQQFDPFISEHLNGRLFQPRNGMFGMDLSSLNIQRARDHGIPGYNAFRELCQTGTRATTFDEFKDWMAPEIINKLRRHYAHPDDVDLWVGGISEAPLPGALIGPTFTCIIGDQFARTKKGDRYFYDLGDQTHSFSPEQLREIRKASFARILCDNGDSLEAVQPSSFLQPDFDFNSLVDCSRSSRISRVNLRMWEDEPTP